MPNTPILVSAEELAATNKAHYPNESAQYRAARNELLVEEIELRRRLEQVASRRRALPPGGELPQDFELPPKKAGSAFPACSATNTRSWLTA